MRACTCAWRHAHTRTCVRLARTCDMRHNSKPHLLFQAQWHRNSHTRTCREGKGYLCLSTRMRVRCAHFTSGAGARCRLLHWYELGLLQEFSFGHCKELGLSELGIAERFQQVRAQRRAGIECCDIGGCQRWKARGAEQHEHRGHRGCRVKSAAGPCVWACRLSPLGCRAKHRTCEHAL